jgi:chemotaxis signal transduction protein
MNGAQEQVVPGIEAPHHGHSVEEAILRARAERLARRSDVAEAGGQELELLTFSVSEERFALPLDRIRGVVALPGCTRVPGARPEVLGVIHVRGELLPLASVRRLLGLPPEEQCPPHALLCAGTRAPALGVDRVHGVVRALRTEVRAPEGAGGSSGCIEGLLADGTALLRADVLFARLLP